MKLVRSILLTAAIALTGMATSAQDLTLPADPQPESLDFAHRTLILQYTGTTCTYCHQMIKALDFLSNDSRYKDLFHLAVCHNYRNDPMNLTPNNLGELDTRTGVPRALVGFTEKVGNNGEENNKTILLTRINTCLGREMMAGVAVNSKLEGNTLKVKAQLKAVKEGQFSIGCWLLEDSIYDAQVNMGMINHNHVIRYAEKAYGNEVGTVKAGETADTDFTITLKDSWVKENCHLIVFACVHSEYKDALGDKYEAKYIMTNVIKVPLNTAVPYEYLSNSAIDEVEVNNEIQVISLGDQVEVIATSPIDEVAIYNMQGRLMQQLSLSSKTASLSLGNLPAGVYMVRAKNTKGVKTEKIIKQ